MDFRAFNQQIKEVCERAIKLEPDMDPQQFVCAILYNAAQVAKLKGCDKENFLRLAGIVWGQMLEQTEASDDKPLIFIPGRN